MKKSPQKVLVTGGAGFVGFHLAKRLAKQSYDISIADNFFRGKRDDDLINLVKLPNVRLIEVDLTEKKAWNKVGVGYDQVYHLASINGTGLFYKVPHEVLRVGVLTAVNVLDWFREQNNKKNAKILYTSSNEAYGGALEAFGKLPIPTPEDVPLVIADTYNSRWSYGGQKLIGELLFIHYAKEFKYRMSIVRPHNFYGPRAGYDHVIPQIIERIVEREEPFTIFGSDDSRSFCYIDDAVEAMQKVMESKNTDGETYHIGTKEEIVIKDLVKLLFKLMEWKPNKIKIKKSPKGSVKRRLADVSKIKKATRWSAKTKLDKGLKRTIDWYIKNPKSN
jgi:UDP-glucose 4-epimerase